MKPIDKARIFYLLIVLALSSIDLQQAKAQPGGAISFQTFYDELSPYGQWIVHPQYGSVWLPDVEPGFQPYATNGRWLMTEFGNTWVSDFVWGWAPFHYGRWFYDNYDGWCWIPGNEWGPAWVAWRSGADYYGWAPLGPGMNININVNIPVNHWVFIPRVYIVHPHVYRYCIPRRQVVRIYSNTVYIHNTYTYNNHVYVCGPRRHEIERVTRRSVPEYRLEHRDRPGRSEMRSTSVAMYRPEVSNQAGSSPRASRPYTPTERMSDSNPRTSRTERTLQPDDRPSFRERNLPSNMERNAYPEHNVYPERNPSSNRENITRRENNQVSQERMLRSQAPQREMRSAPSASSHDRQPERISPQRSTSAPFQQSRVDRQARVQRQPESPGSSSREQRSSGESTGRSRRD
jgi:hypothetical protein